VQYFVCGTIESGNRNSVKSLCLICFLSVSQLRKCAKEFRSCGELYWKLYQSAFDADPASLANIQMYPSKNISVMCDELIAWSIKQSYQVLHLDG
jgi:hypothetical protein